jgi:23S rRNA (cytosine1962-C5)-methyltransferase
MEPKVLIAESQEGYELIDCGEGEKLERYGSYIVRRPDPQALWKKILPESEWNKAQAVFMVDENKKATWKINETMPKRWEISYEGLKFWIKPSSFKHTGLFPEQVDNWKWLKGKLSSVQKPRVLNLFGYTGGATLAAAQAGAEVVHVDGSKVAITWARENAEISGLKEKPIRWILDDAAAFVKRELRRGVHYDGIIMDPPTFGHGPDGQLWKIEEHLIPLLEDCVALLSDTPLFFILNGYASGYSSLAYKQTLSSILKTKNGDVAYGELTIASKTGMMLPAGIFARWSL